MTQLIVIKNKDGTVTRYWIGEEEPPADQVQEGDIWKQQMERDY